MKKTMLCVIAFILSVLVLAACAQANGSISETGTASSASPADTSTASVDESLPEPGSDPDDGSESEATDNGYLTDPAVVWGGPSTDGGTTTLGGKTIGTGLENAIDNAGEGAVIAVIAGAIHCSNGDYVYNGKTVAEYEAALDEFEGDPEKEGYQAAFDAYNAALRDYCDSAEEAACAAFRQQEIPYHKGKALYIFVTREQFESLVLDNVGDWIFESASQPSADF